MENKAKDTPNQKFAKEWEVANLSCHEMISRHDPIYVNIENHLRNFVVTLNSNTKEDYMLLTFAPQLDINGQSSNISFDICQNNVKRFEHKTLSLAFRITEHNIEFKRHLFLYNMENLYETIDSILFLHFSPSNTSAVLANEYAKIDNQI